MVTSKSQQIKDLLNRIIDGTSTSLNKRKHEYRYCQNFILLFLVPFDNFSDFPEWTNVTTTNAQESKLIGENLTVELILNYAMIKNMEC